MDINKKRFTISIAKKLLYMLEGRTLPSSSLPRWIVDEFRIEGLITGITSGSRGAIVTVVVNGQNVRLLLSRIVLKFRYGSTMCLF